jgi:hypothetical protein
LKLFAEVSNCVCLCYGEVAQGLKDSGWRLVYVFLAVLSKSNERDDKNKRFIVLFCVKFLPESVRISGFVKRVTITLLLIKKMN